MHDSVRVVRMQPVDTGVIRRDADPRRKRCLLPIDIEREMRVDMEVAMFTAIAGNSMNGSIGGIRRSMALHHEKGDQTSQRQRNRGEDTNGQTLCASSTPPLCFPTLLRFLAALLPGWLMGRWFAHTLSFAKNRDGVCFPFCSRKAFPFPRGRFAAKPVARAM